ncbi:sulfatase family protein [Aureliella helgolandensis]|uniref:Arylsulfatase n=1 Tax=Aureliella helgolandensis TaxID=2527968 RepID=A0A518G8T7_9BACT|nr:sulfatase-like hydrolase/transferase [Aureliella helgolandensis]QDV25018.1 Arylsulfatase [Aureliella helgolandensis]
MRRIRCMIPPAAAQLGWFGIFCWGLFTSSLSLLANPQDAPAADREDQDAASPQSPNIVLVMADDQGWGETSYNHHPRLKTPNLDQMAAAGARFDRFYAGAPVCSPTRASVLTGRSNRRTGVESHGYALRLQERTLPQALQAAGYSTGHFGKWHLNGLRGPGVPILSSDSHHPGNFGFDHWLSVTNFFDRNPLLSRDGRIEDFRGDSSEIVVEEALQFIAGQAARKRPSFTVIWFGSPHSPFVALDADTEPFMDLNETSRNHYGELVALDRSIGRLRAELRSLGIERETLVWYCSDNGGLPKITPETVGGLRGFKGQLYEGGVRVPAIVEWPSHIEPTRIAKFPACVMDMVPTLVELVGAQADSLLGVQDGTSLWPILRGATERRNKVIPFSYQDEFAIIDNEFKLLQLGKASKHYELYNLEQDPGESEDLFEANPSIARRMLVDMQAWQTSLNRSLSGLDYPEQSVNAENPEPSRWETQERYQPYLKSWGQRPEYQSVLNGRD